MVYSFCIRITSITCFWGFAVISGYWLMDGGFRTLRVKVLLLHVHIYSIRYWTSFFSVNYELTVSSCCKRYRYIYIYIYIYVNGHKWSTIHRGLRSHRSKMCVIYMQSWKQCTLPVIITMALWHLMHLGTWYTVVVISGRAMIYIYVYYV